MGFLKSIPCIFTQMIFSGAVWICSGHKSRFDKPFGSLASKDRTVIVLVFSFDEM